MVLRGVHVEAEMQRHTWLSSFGKGSATFFYKIRSWNSENPIAIEHINVNGSSNDVRAVITMKGRASEKKKVPAGQCTSNVGRHQSSSSSTLWKFESFDLIGFNLAITNILVQGSIQTFFIWKTYKNIMTPP